MRMWMVLPRLMCNQHLLGEHVELHMFVGTIRRGISLTGYIDNGLLDSSRIVMRHEQLVKEMKIRGFSHKSPLSYNDRLCVGTINRKASRAELSRRCDKCRERINHHYNK